MVAVARHGHVTLIETEPTSNRLATAPWPASSKRTTGTAPRLTTAAATSPTSD